MALELMSYLAIPFLFLLVVLYVFRPSGKKQYEEDGKIPFKEKELEESSSKE